ncbi:MAG TPA: hypothetical protein VEQ42_11295 [Pyrinomonadaceae bacterium]|nr:hypothetical protein [Pyrinomonadaceae bacterium]
MSTPRPHNTSTLRPLVLSLIILSLLCYGLPVSDSLAARFNRRTSASRSKAKKLRQRRSRAWWRKRRAMLRRRRARQLAMRRRLALTAAPSNPAATNPTPAKARDPRPNAALSSVTRRAADASRNASVALRVAPGLPVAANLSARAPRATPYDLTLPASWSSAGAGPSGEMRFHVRALDGTSAGTAALSPMTAPVSDAPAGPRAKKLGNVPLAAVRSTVIERMVKEGGWVVNDMERVIADRRVYVVIAQTGDPSGPQRRWTFYFTEVEGRLYRLVTATPLEQSEPVAAASERLVASFRLGAGPALASKSPR